jgi:hypothetical protein
MNGPHAPTDQIGIHRTGLLGLHDDYRTHLERSHDLSLDLTARLDSGFIVNFAFEAICLLERAEHEQDHGCPHGGIHP